MKLALSHAHNFHILEVETTRASKYAKPKEKNVDGSGYRSDSVEVNRIRAKPDRARANRAS